MKPGVPQFEVTCHVTNESLISTSPSPFIVRISHHQRLSPSLPECSNLKGQSKRVGRHVTRIIRCCESGEMDL
ncbi:hypothetical protein SDJN02_25843, partial [Cucurbita argyrosperma subsp. argyrosperma]